MTRKVSRCGVAMRTKNEINLLAVSCHLFFFYFLFSRFRFIRDHVTMCDPIHSLNQLT